MSTEVTCRGCRIRVARGAQSCYACNCPYPTCHLPEVPERSIRLTHWRWAAPAGFGLLLVAVAAIWLCFAAFHGGHSAVHHLPTTGAHLSGTR